MTIIDSPSLVTAGRYDELNIVDEISSFLALPAERVDQLLAADREPIKAAVRALNDSVRSGDAGALYRQQLLLSRIYATIMKIPDSATSEGSIIIHEVTRLLEIATIAAEDRWIEPGTIEAAPDGGPAYLSWLKGLARTHPVFKHPYYAEFINRQASRDDLRTYVIQESLVDGRFDDFLAMMQVGTVGAAKMEIANNFWDEMGNGEPEEVHTTLFNQIYQVFDIVEEELEAAMTANDLLSGNLAVLLCRYRHLYPEAVGYLGMTEWLAPDRFRNVVRAWERLGLPDVGIVYHRLHVTIDSRHAAGWFHNVVVPASTSEYMRRGIARGSLWRLNSSARHLDERLAQAVAGT
ncbi:iron-containing redox enzyme family protein [Dactylosporangium sp. NPDC051484]|uniref:iron-containing redox enzyme family protein n=1 Tax=Dactylosporangium sp. NPDC051484 TaxID=3154942 RepID=UPI00344E572E